LADSGDFRNPSLSVDAIALRERAGVVEVLLIRRGHPPYQGRLAFPGGFVDLGEDPEDAVLRELLEETHVSGSDPELFAVRGDPERDPRKHIVSIFYLVKVNPDSVPRAGDDASDAKWIDISRLKAEDVAGDHISVIDELRE
tara:strand:- start:3350 stop:3775 length:426 start_codon:yes stop_codon:yes gene_type:complete